MYGCRLQATGTTRLFASTGHPSCFERPQTPGLSVSAPLPPLLGPLEVASSAGWPGSRCQRGPVCTGQVRSGILLTGSESRRLRLGRPEGTSLAARPWGLRPRASCRRRPRTGPHASGSGRPGVAGQACPVPRVDVSFLSFVGSRVSDSHSGWLRTNWTSLAMDPLLRRHGALASMAALRFCEARSCRSYERGSRTLDRPRALKCLSTSKDDSLATRTLCS